MQTIRTELQYGSFFGRSLNKLLFEELKMDSGQWKVNVSTAWIYLKYIAEGDTTTVNCQLSTFNFPLRSFK